MASLTDPTLRVPQGNPSEARLISLSTVTDSRGVLTCVEGIRDLPFEIRRVFYLYDVPPAEVRGGHAHNVEQQVLVCLKGSFDVVVESRQGTQSYHLNNPREGLFLPELTWATEKNFSAGSLCLVFSSTLYDAKDYIHDLLHFRRILSRSAV